MYQPYVKLVHSLKHGGGLVDNFVPHPSFFHVSDDGSGLQQRAMHTTPDVKKMMANDHNAHVHIEHYSIPAGSIDHKAGSDLAKDYFSGPRTPRTMLEHNLMYEHLCMPDDNLPTVDDPAVLRKIYHTCNPTFTLTSPYDVKQGDDDSE
jgi:hypothetical protein